MNKELHYKYIISYLLVAIITLLSLAYFDVPDLVDKFSFALTLSSLLLSVLAIFYSIIASNKQDEQFLKVIEANGKLKGSVEDIQNASRAISELARDIPEHFNRLDGKISDLSNNYLSISDETASGLEPLNNQHHTNVTAEHLRDMVFRLQFSAMAVLYAFVKAAHYSKPLSLDDIGDLENIEAYYGVGVLNGFETTGLIDFTVHEQCIIPTHCDALLYQEYRNILDKVILSVNKESSDRLKELLEKIDGKYT